MSMIFWHVDVFEDVFHGSSGEVFSSYVLLHIKHNIVQYTRWIVDDPAWTQQRPLAV